VARIEEKKAELENLKQLRDLSAAVAGQMEALEQKLSTLSDGTEGSKSPALVCYACEEI
jgi:DASH complex subunit DAD2